MKKLDIKLRAIQNDDLEAIVALFKETIHHVNAADYTSEQLLVWAPSHAHHHDERWKSLLDNLAYVAIHKSQIVSSFILAISLSTLFLKNVCMQTQF